MRILALLEAVALWFSTMVWAAGPGWVAQLRTSGVVLTNSAPLPDGGTVHSGDIITTRAASLAIVTSPIHGRVEVRPDSEARLDADSIDLARGAVASSRLPVVTGEFTIRPQRPSGAWYAVARRNGKLLVAAHRGNLLIAVTGAPPLLVEEGSYATDDDDQQSGPADKSADKKKKRRTHAAAGAATTGGWTIGRLSHAASVALVVGAGAAVAATTAGVALLNDSSPSPDD